MKKMTNRMRKTVLAGTLLVVLGGLCGCDDYDYGYGNDYYTPDYGYYGSPIDWDVFESANDAWGDYIRG